MARILAALGGNALVAANDRAAFADQMANVKLACSKLAELVKQGHDLIITHGNGPQIGTVLLQTEELARKSGVQPAPLDACGAQTQGLIGYMIQQALSSELAQRGIAKQVAAVLTRVEVDPADKAFAAPEKPIGPYYPEAAPLDASWPSKYVPGKGWRRVVASPEPLRILEQDSIRLLAESGVVVVACGGGGVPVITNDDGTVTGVEAVIDKDLASQALASGLGADVLLIITDVDGVAVGYGTKEERFLSSVTVDEMRELQAQQCFPAGSIGPKVEAAVRFVLGGGQVAVIASLQRVEDSLNGAGTRITAH